MIDGFFLAFSYFSILPLYKKIEFNQKTYRWTMFFLPFVGIILSLLTIILFLFLKLLSFPIWYGAFLASIFYITLYGFLHLEALIDVIDGWFASFSNKDVYKIMKEPTIGAIGAIGGFLIIIIKIVSISYLLYNHAFLFLFLSTTLSRLSILISIYLFNFHKKSLFLLSFKESFSLKFLLFTISVYSISFFNLYFFIFGIVASLFFLGILKILQNRFSFLNGDCIGFSIEITEITLFQLGILLINN